MYKKKPHSLIILIPSYNELSNLKKFILTLNKNFNLLIVDDASKDKSSKWLKENDINYIINKKNLGYERTIIKGMNYLLKKRKYDFIITMDADGEHRIKELDKFFFNDFKKYDIIVGNRNKKNRLLEVKISKNFYKKFNIKDPLSGFKLYRPKFLRKLKLNSFRNLFLVDLLSKSIREGANVKNININVKKRIDQSRLGNKTQVSKKMKKILKFISETKIS
tara:strand:+ start:498 stop:1160 length:663 start_codon:yes stop_codon:yes gene_type:complete